MKHRALTILLGTIIALDVNIPAHAEKLIVSVSNHRITVTPNYSGEELVLFGAIERDGKSLPERTNYDIIVTVTGPRADMVTRHKERKLGIWVNTESREFIQVPSYLGIFANRPINVIASTDIRRREQLGLDNMPLPQRTDSGIGESSANDLFRTAFLRLRSEHGLYREQTNAVTFLTPTLFRTGISIPAEVPTGPYTVNIVLLANGNVVTKTETAFEIVKIGFEQFVANAARQHGLLYGLTTAIMALITGWLASVIFRKD